MLLSLNSKLVMKLFNTLTTTDRKCIICSVIYGLISAVSEMWQKREEKQNQQDRYQQIDRSLNRYCCSSFLSNQLPVHWDIFKRRIQWQIWSYHYCRLVCKIKEKRSSNQQLTITLEVHEKDAEQRYSIQGTAQMPGFSFVVRMTFIPIEQLWNDAWILEIRWWLSC